MLKGLQISQEEELDQEEELGQQEEENLKDQQRVINSLKKVKLHSQLS